MPSGARAERRRTSALPLLADMFGQTAQRFEDAVIIVVVGTQLQTKAYCHRQCAPPHINGIQPQAFSVQRRIWIDIGCRHIQVQGLNNQFGNLALQRRVVRSGIFSSHNMFSCRVSNERRRVFGRRRIAQGWYVTAPRGAVQYSPCVFAVLKTTRRYAPQRRNHSGLRALYSENMPSSTWRLASVKPAFSSVCITFSGFAQASMVSQ